MTEIPSVTYLFSDIEGSTRLWESNPEAAARALAWHDHVSREVVRRHRGTVVKMTGDGLHAAFAEPADALAAVIDLQLELASSDGGAPLKVRCGLHLGADERRDNDFYGRDVNRAVRIMSAAHGGQILLSHAVAQRVATALPEQVALRELGEVRLRDLSNPERVYQVVHPALRADFPALRSLASTPNNLPQQLNSFVDRQQEMAELRGLLARHRLVTLLAMGGIGKSRLSIQLGAEVLDEFPDGVWLVELAPIDDPAHVPQAAAAVLGVREEPGGGAVVALERFARDRRLLVILDNCEHVVRAAADLAKRLLTAGPHVKVLASSRDPLQIAGETIFHVPTLPIPQSGDVRPDALAQHASVQLFIDRASAVQPAFRLNERSAAAVGEVCRKLNGIPLAIELAAARTRSLPIDTIAARLDQRFRLLSTGDQTVLPRQRTLRALIDWSHDLLTARERAAFARLAVFAGGWTLDAAEAVVSGDDVQMAEVIDLLASLVEKSLVALEADSGRYRMLDTVRHYANDRLVESGDERVSRARHCMHFVSVAERARAALGTSEQNSRLRELERDHDNLLAAFAASELVPAEDAGLRLMRALRFYLIRRGMPSVLAAMAVELSERPQYSGRSQARYQILFSAGQASSFMARYAEARTQLQQSLDIARELGDPDAIQATLQPLGIAILGERDFDRARQCFVEALDLATKAANQRERAAALNNIGGLYRVEGDLVGAAHAYEQALAVARLLKDEESVATVLLNLAMTKVLYDEPLRAVEMLSEVVAIGTQLGSVAVMQSAIEVVAGLAAWQGEWSVAARLYGFAESEATRTGLHRDPADDAYIAACMARARAAGGAGFEAADAQGRTSSIAQAIDEVQRFLARGAITSC